MPGNSFNQAIPLKINGEDGMYLVGQMVFDVPFLARNSLGALALPNFVRTEAGLSMLDEKEAVVLVDNHIANVEIPPPPAKFDIRTLQIPSIAVNVSNEPVKFFNLMANETNAERFLFTHKGDTVVIIGRLKKLRVPHTDIVKPVLLVDNINTVRVKRT